MDAPITREQLDELERGLRPVIARFLAEPATDTEVMITCTPVRDDPAGASIMRVEVKVRGQVISSDQEEMLTRLLSTPSPKVAKV